jgi:acyl-CoA thioesterase-1
MKPVGVSATILAALVLGLWAFRPSLPATPPAPLKNDAGIDTLVVFGTSLSSAPRYSWPDDLAAALGTCTATTSNHLPKVQRVTKAGANSTWGLENIDIVSQAKPDLVIIEFAINDADLLDGVTPERSRENHAAILNDLHTRLPDARILLMTTNPVSGLNWLKRYRLGTHYRLYTSLSQTYETGLIHMGPHWHGFSIPDGVHPRNGDASAVMVPQLIETLTNGRCTLPS